MLLSYKKPVEVSSFQEEYIAENLVDENVQSFWVADKNSDSQWVKIDLEKKVLVKAIQINYNDYKSDIYGKVPGLYHQYILESSLNGSDWNVIVDKTENKSDMPNDYVVLKNPIETQYIRFKNIHAPTTNLSISDIRIFGNGFGKKPKSVKTLQVQRNDRKRGAKVTWNATKDTQGYNILWGIAPDKLYSSWMVYDNTSLDIKSLNVDQTYYFTIEAFNENGVSASSEIIKVP